MKPPTHKLSKLDINKIRTLRMLQKVERHHTADLDKLRAKITALTVALGSDAIGWAVEHAPLSSVTSLPNLL